MEFAIYLLPDTNNTACRALGQCCRPTKRSRLKALYIFASQENFCRDSLKHEQPWLEHIQEEETETGIR